MKFTALTCAAAALSILTINPADARSCRRLNKTEGAVIGVVAGGVLGNVIAGRGSRTTGTLVGAAAGGVAGHEIARTRHQRCARSR